MWRAAAWLLAGTLIALASLAALLAMVAGALEVGLLRSLLAYAALFVGVFIALGGILRFLRAG
ncbi:hypothetical protein [Aquisalimonas asiatica]|uniref:Uncharacterized protein n=1 Tax=Aquisalimonas asiatica TaxID=406100 RepID=A0A1H8V736_9GAMM|nr:hypothetical protein [Aquisalimonas asiatica]SEP11255.1 hypothetical protein SAMN04488052_11057 [Aquisalimonas asiatica]